MAHRIVAASVSGLLLLAASACTITIQSGPASPATQGYYSAEATPAYEGGVLRAPLSTEQLPPNPDALVSMALKKRFSATAAADPGVAASRLPAGYSNS